MGSKGVYKAKVEVKDSSGNFLPKEANDGYSSFFPDAWDEERTLEEIAYALGNKRPVGNSSSVFDGFSTDGIPIRIILDESGNVFTAFPFFP